MSVIKPEIDNLLDKTEHNPFLLCSMASKRACDINNMIRGQHLRVVDVQDFDDITTVVSGEDPVSIAMKEIEDGTLGFVKDALPNPADFIQTESRADAIIIDEESIGKDDAGNDIEMAVVTVHGAHALVPKQDSG